MAPPPSSPLPRVGMFATVRNRRGVVAAVEPFDGETGRIHLVHLEYKDDQLPVEERLLWELEPRKRLLEPTALPDAAGTDPMPGEDYDALLRASRWTALFPYLDPDGEGPVNREPISSPFHGAVQVEDYQLVPLLKALRMPRVNLLIADDVGLGKTVEAGLILTELLLRRRIQRVLILTPASLRLQWQEEMWDKFSLSFDLVDLAETHALRKRLGADANPWRSFNRIVTSYHYLRQENVLEQFLAACRTPEGAAHLPWDLLIVDECHNLMPSAFGDDSDLCRTLRLVAPQFEHRLFLSATPHNGHTRCFTGLLEILDPVRFSQTDQLKPAEKERVREIVIRRLKREINARTTPPRFCDRRPPSPCLLTMKPAEVALCEAFSSFRTEVKRLVGQEGGRRRRSGSFAVEILGKRLLSSPTAFAESWRRCKQGLAQSEAADESDVASAEKALRRETADDRESQAREASAAGVVGAWLKTVASGLANEISAIDRAVAQLGFDLRAEPGAREVVEQDPAADARLEVFLGLVESLLRSKGKWRDDERLVVFTEYKTTLDYLVRRLRARYEPDRLLTLFGGMDEGERKLVKDAFNDPSEKVRLLIATDAASEGLNLQRTARYLLHYDCPWNPSKLEQRNGRLDRHGQARDVTVYHFVSNQDQDLRFLAHVIAKAHEIREDLGSANELFDEAAHRRLVEGESLASVQADLDRRIAAARGRATVEADDTVHTRSEGTAGGGASDAFDTLAATAAEIDLDPESLRDTLEAALAIRVGRPQLDCDAEKKTCKLLNPGLPGWAEVVDESLRLSTRRGERGPVARLAFSPEPFLENTGGRLVFSPRPEVRLLHLSHPVYQKALGSLTRRRFPGTGESVSRWTVRFGHVPDGTDGVLLLSLEELAINDLRESFHHWIRTVALPLRRGKLGDPLPHRPARVLRGDLKAGAPPSTAHHERARDLLVDVETEVRAYLGRHQQKLAGDLLRQLDLEGRGARTREDERYRSRQGEVSSLIEENTLAKLEKEVEKLKLERKQGLLFDEDGTLDKIDRSIDDKREEIARRRDHYEEVRKQLDRERERVLKVLLPRRYAMSAPPQVFPVGFEVRLPGAGA